MPPPIHLLRDPELGFTDSTVAKVRSNSPGPSNFTRTNNFSNSYSSDTNANNQRYSLFSAPSTVSSRFRSSSPSPNRLQVASANNVNKSVRFTSPSRKEKDFLCYNCRGSGHSYFTCRAPPTRFCYNCGKQNVCTIDCDCKEKGNRSRQRSPVPTQRGKLTKRDVKACDVSSEDLITFNEFPDVQEN